MQEILAYLNKITLGVLHPFVFDEVIDGIECTVNKPAVLRIGDSQRYDVVLESVDVYFDKCRREQRLFLRCNFLAEPEVVQRWRQRPSGALQVFVNDLPVLTCVAHWTQSAYLGSASITVADNWLEDDDPELWNLCEKYWPT